MITIITLINLRLNADIKIKQNLIKQLTNPVKWTQTMENMKHDKLISATEVGPGKVLQGLFKKTFRDINTKSLHQIIV